MSVTPDFDPGPLSLPGTVAVPARLFSKVLESCIRAARALAALHRIYRLRRKPPPKGVPVEVPSP